jgi:hypothetical protein
MTPNDRIPIDALRTRLLSVANPGLSACLLVGLRVCCCVTCTGVANALYDELDNADVKPSPKPGIIAVCTRLCKFARVCEHVW